MDQTITVTATDEQSGRTFTATWTPESGVTIREGEAVLATGCAVLGTGRRKSLRGAGNVFAAVVTDLAWALADAGVPAEPTAWASGF
jgi:hypothetical protein